MEGKFYYYIINNEECQITLLHQHKNKYNILYTTEKLKSLERTVTSRRDTFVKLLDDVNDVKEKIKASSLNTTQNSEILDKLSQIQNTLRPELGFTRAFLDEVKRQQLVL